MGEQVIPEQLLADCHLLGRFQASTVLLHRNAAVPWFILVPQTPLCDFLDLPDAVREEVVCQCVSISAFIKQELGFDKVNFAGLGNVVPAMHLHIIGRRPQDACWPQPVWGNLPEGASYSAEKLRDWQTRLARRTGLQPASPADHE